ncbi:MAG: hypothetical protein KDK70_07850 [Myxococcales bacterium]|nr:hypothetical protein [Myxococcales bacterium]
MSMQKRVVLGLGAACFWSLGCGDPLPGGGSDSAGDESPTTQTTAPGTTDTPTSAGTGSGSATGDDSGGTSTGEDPDGSTSSQPIKLDLGIIPDMPPPVCGGAGSGDLELSYIWIANSQQGTISKIDTTTMVEEGRYQAKPFNGDPSRTSVNLVGDVAVANRNGGVAKFWAEEENCVSSNGIPGIQTSTGAANVLAWGQDDCLAWYTDFVCSSNRPVAWTRGEFNEAECAYEGMDLWTVCDSQVHLLDGETGAIEDTILLPGGGWNFVYGGAADADGNFWGLDTGNGQLFRIDFQTRAYQAWPLPPPGGYGITVDSVGRPWVCGGGTVSRFNLDTSTWDSSAGGFGGIGGCMTDGADLIWHGNDFGLVMGFNIETLAVDEQVQMPQYVHGISVDFQGKVWGVSFAGSSAYRADPSTGVVDSYNGLVGAYTYSDMTGHALSTVGGGGTPQN